MKKELSAKTRAEMYRGGASVGTSKEEVDAQMALAAAYSKVGDWEYSMRIGEDGAKAKAMVWQKDGEIIVEPFVVRNGRKSMAFPMESIDEFPSPTLMAQLMLVL